MRQGEQKKEGPGDRLRHLRGSCGSGGRGIVKLGKGTRGGSPEELKKEKGLERQIKQYRVTESWWMGSLKADHQENGKHQTGGEN